MSRRSPNNERYQKFTEPKGQTRKSSASAKPVRKEGSGTDTKSKTKTASKSSAKPYYEPDTPEYKFWRKMWWISLGVGLAFVAISFFIQYYLKAQGPLRVVGVVCIALSYVGIIAAFLIDWRRMRPMRQGTWKAAEPKPVKAAKPEDTSDAGTSGDDE